MPNLFFCDDPSHKHDNLADELIRQYGCRTRDELHEKLAVAAAWASEHKLETNSQSGNWYEYTLVGSGVQLGRITIRIETLLAPPRHNIECPHYEHLLQAALCLLVYSHSFLRREVEIAPHSGPERERWQLIECFRDIGPHDYECFQSFAQYVRECWGDDEAARLFPPKEH